MYIFIHSIFCFYKLFVIEFCVLVCVYTYVNGYVYVIYFKRFCLCLVALVYVCAFVCVSLE